jgi:hypothetical protein
VTGGEYQVLNGPQIAKSVLNTVIASSFTLEADIKILDAGQASLIFDVANPGIGGDAFQGYGVGIDTNGTVWTGKFNNDYTLIDTVAAAISSNTWYHLKIEVSSGHYRVYLDGSARLDIYDAAYAPGGKVGVRGGFNNAIHFDNVSIATLAATPSPTPTQSLNSYVALYKFTGNTMDSGAHGLLLTNSGAILTQNRAPAFNKAYAYAGIPSAPDYMEHADNSWFNFTSEFTISVWVKLTDPSQNQKIVSKWIPGQDGYILAVDQNHVYFQVFAGGSYCGNETGGSITSNSWTHLAMTWKSGGKITAYVNGVQVNQSMSGIPPMSWSGAGVFRIGAPSWDSTVFNVQGSIDDIRLYGKELNGAQVAALAALPAD